MTIKEFSEHFSLKLSTYGKAFHITLFQGKYCTRAIYLKCWVPGRSNKCRDSRASMRKGRWLILIYKQFSSTLANKPFKPFPIIVIRSLIRLEAVSIWSRNRKVAQYRYLSSDRYNFFLCNLDLFEINWLNLFYMDILYIYLLTHLN